MVLNEAETDSLVDTDWLKLNEVEANSLAETGLGLRLNDAE